MTYFDDIVGDAITAFADALRDAGFWISGEHPIMDGQWHRCAVSGDKGRKQSGTYWGRLDGDAPHGFIRNWKDDSRTGGWRFKSNRPVRSAAEHEAAQRIMEAARTKEAAERATKAAAAAQACRAEWSKATPAPDNHPYLLRKQISANGLRVLGNRLLAPMHDFNGELQGVQTIYADGIKRFRKDGTTKDLHCLLGNVLENGWLLICEGYATGATLHAETGFPVAVAYDKRNYVSIARHYQDRTGGLRVAFAGDDDGEIDKNGKPKINVGKVEAEDAAIEVGGVAAVPDFRPEHSGNDWSDWNDFAALYGGAAMRAAVLAKLDMGQPATPAAVQPPHFARPWMDGATAKRRLERIVDGVFGRLDRWRAAHVWMTEQSLGDLSTAKIRKEAIARFGKRAVQKTLPAVQIRGVAGLGKSTAFIRAYLSRPWLWELNIEFYLPDLDVMSDMEAEFQNIKREMQDAGELPEFAPGKGPRALVIRGRLAKGLCHKDRHELVKAAGDTDVRSVHAACCHTPATNGNPEYKCPFYAECKKDWYLSQFEDKNPAFRILSHARSISPGPEELRLPSADLAIIDESVISNLTDHLTIYPSYLTDSENYSSEPEEEFKIQESLDIGKIVAECMARGGEWLRAIRDKLMETAFTASNGKLGILDAQQEAEKLLYQAGTCAKLGYMHAMPKVNAGMDAKSAAKLLRAHKRHPGQNMGKLFAFLAKDMNRGKRIPYTVEWDAEHTIKNEKGEDIPHPVAYVHHVVDAAALPKSVPLVLLDADAITTANISLTRRKIQAFDINARRMAYVTQVSDVSLPNCTIALENSQGKDKAARKEITQFVRSKVVDGKRVLVIATRTVRCILTGEDNGKRLDDFKEWEGAEITHFGRFKGKNRWSMFDTVIIIGREEIKAINAERTARAIYGQVEGVSLTLGKQYERQARAHDMRHEAQPPVSVRVHPDPLVQGLIEVPRENAMGQGVDRLRLIHRQPERAAEVFILCNIPVSGMVVDRLMSWEDMKAGGTVWERALDRMPVGVLPLSLAWLRENLPDMFGSDTTLDAKLATFVKNPSLINGLCREWSRQRKPPFGNIRSYCQTGVFFAEFRLKKTKFSKCLVAYTEFVSDFRSYIATELRKLPGLDVPGLEVRLIPAAMPVQATGLHFAPGAVTVRTMIERGRLALAKFNAIPQPPEEMEDSRDGMRYDKWHAETLAALAAVTQPKSEEWSERGAV